MSETIFPPSLKRVEGFAGAGPDLRKKSAVEISHLAASFQAALRETEGQVRAEKAGPKGTFEGRPVYSMLLRLPFALLCYQI